MPNHELYRESKREGVDVIDLAADPELAERLLTGRLAKCTSCKRTAKSITFPSLFNYEGPESREAANHCSHETEPKPEWRYKYPDVKVWRCGYAPCAHLPINPLTDRPTTLDHDFVPSEGAEFDTWYCGCRGWD